MKAEGNTRKQKESNQKRTITDLAVSATEQIQKQVDKSLEPKLDILLAKKVKVNALKTKPHKNSIINSKATRQNPKSNLQKGSLK